MLHARWSAGRKSTYFYHFTHEGPELHEPHNSSYPPNGSVRGDELPFLMGAPLISSPLGFFSSNYTRPEVTLSYVMMKFWSSFAHTGSPSSASATGSGSRDSSFLNSADLMKEMSKQGGSDANFTSVYWPAYDEKQQQYMSIGKRINWHLMQSHNALLAIYHTS